MAATLNACVFGGQQQGIVSQAYGGIKGEGVGEPVFAVFQDLTTRAGQVALLGHLKLRLRGGELGEDGGRPEGI